MFDVISIGSATIDLFVISDVFRIKNKELILPYSSKNEIKTSLIASGGGATNSSVAFSRLGLKSACFSLIGQSHLNNYIFDDLKKDKVDSTFIVQNKKDITDLSIVLVAPDGTRSILTDRGSTGLTEKNASWSKLKETKWFHITSIEGNINLLEKLIGFAKENDIRISFNPGKRELSQSRKILPLLREIDCLFLNKQEAELLLDKKYSDKTFFKDIKLLASDYIIITNGRKGAHLFNSDKHLFSPALDVLPIDETGAGDSFASTFISALIHKQPPQEALFWAIKNSASVVSCLGAKKGLLKLKEIKNSQ